MPTRDRSLVLVPILVAGLTLTAAAQDAPDLPTTADRPGHRESAEQHDEAPPPEVETPPLPEGMTLDEVLERAASPPPAAWPDPVPDTRPYVFAFVEQLEWRFGADDAPDHLGWEAWGWAGGDINKLWWKHEGEAVFAGSDRGETETDLLYSRLVTPFWSVQAGAQYANEWHGGEYEDRVSAAVALQGLVPYKIELDASGYLSEDGDVTVELEAEYDVRITQRLVVQPRLEAGIAAQDIPERRLASGFTDVALDLRLRYELRRELAPYLGIRYDTLLGDTADLAEAASETTDNLRVLAGLRFAF
ncbi:MAG TPA: copper resistance protein B [Methylomirabilota bacterium]|nr:copper resistance protein B [Methylomirabilota bacterium]